MMKDTVYFVSGVLTMGYAVASLFFLRFWRQTHDRLFGFFALTFALLAVQRALLTVVQPAEILYALRLVAFLLLVVAIVEKNRSAA
jgi:hypothetical protein